MSDTNPSEISTISCERFEILRLLGVGGMGSVFLAHDRVRRQNVALKTLGQLTGSSVYNFKREFRSLSNIVHKNLVTLYELLVLDESWFFTMTHVDGVSFLEYMRPHSHLLPPGVSQLITGLGQYNINDPIPLSQVLGNMDTQQLPEDQSGDVTLVVTRSMSDKGPSERRRSAIKSAELFVDKLHWTLPQLATGLHALHQAGKLHRDIKPNNILVTQEGQVSLCDFGLVVDTRTKEDSDRKEGTPAYMSPEQVVGTEICPASDWYSFGIVLYEVLTGQLPFEGPTREAMEARCQIDGPSPSGTGLEIPSNLDELCTALLKLDPQSRPTGEEVLETLGCNEAALGSSMSGTGTDTKEFVGRRKQLEALLEAYDLVCKGHNVAAFVHGPSGIGKSLLIEHFLDELAQHEEVMIFKGRCYERESVPFKALDSLVDGLSRTLLKLPPARREQILPRDLPALARLFPTMQQLSEKLADTTIGIQDAQELRHRAFAALRYLLRMLALDRPTVIYIDDLQWGDMDSAPFLNDLVHHPQAPPLLLLASYRSDEAQRSPLIQNILNPGTGITGDLRDIPLKPFDNDEARDLALQLMGEGSADRQSVAQSIVVEAGGNPMFISELALSVREFGKVGQDLHLDDVIYQRIRALPEDARALLTAAAVAARPLPVRVLSQALELEGEASALAALQAKRMIRTRRVQGVEEVETYHDRIRESTASRLAADELTALNRKLAIALEGWGHAEPIALVQFWQKAGDDDKAGHYAALAAADAAQTLAFDRAAHHYKVALELNKNLAAAERLALLESRADTLANGGALLEAAEVFQQAAKLACRFHAINLQRKALEQLLRTGTLEVDAQLTHTVLKAVGMKAPSGRFRAIFNFLWRRILLRLRGYKFKPRSEEDIDPDILQKIDVCWSVSSALTFVQPLYGYIVQMQMTSLTLEAGDPYRVAASLTLEMGFLAAGGSPNASQVRELTDYTREVAFYSGNPTATAFAKTMVALCYYLMGDFESSLTHFPVGEKELRQLGTLRWVANTCSIYRMALCLYLGKVRQLTEEMPVLLKQAMEHGDTHLAECLRKWRSNVMWLVLDDPDEATRQAGTYTGNTVHGTNFHLHHYYELATHTQILLYRGNGLGAWVMMEDAIRRMRMALIKKVQTVRIEGAFTAGRCALAAAVDDPKKRPQWLAQVTRSIRALNKENVLWAKALASLLEASQATLQGRQTQAIELFRHAEARLQAANFRLFATIARLRRGCLTGGEKGQQLVQISTDWLKSEAIRNPDRFASLYAPDHRLPAD